MADFEWFIQPRAVDLHDALWGYFEGHEKHCDCRFAGVVWGE